MQAPYPHVCSVYMQAPYPHICNVYMQAPYPPVCSVYMKAPYLPICSPVWDGDRLSSPPHSSVNSKNPKYSPFQIIIKVYLFGGEDRTYFIINVLPLFLNFCVLSIWYVGLHLLFFPTVKVRLAPREPVLNHIKYLQFLNCSSFWNISYIARIFPLFTMPESLLGLEASFKKVKGKNCHYCLYFLILLWKY